MQRSWNCFGQHVMGLSKFPDGGTPVNGDLSGDISSDSQIPDLPLAVKEPQVWPPVSPPSLFF